MPFTRSSSSSPRSALRVVKVARPAGRGANPDTRASRSRLPADSLAYSLRLAATTIAAVRCGASLTQALARLAGEPPGARAAAQELAYGALRCHGRGDFILARLLERALPHAETEALLLAAIYRLQTRPEAAHTVVDQAVAAAGEMANGAFRGLVNGVLRNYLRCRDELHAALAEDEPAACQHPQWWLDRLRRAYPEHWREIVAINNGQPPMSLRVNQRRTTLAAYCALLHAAGLSARPAGGHALILAQPVPIEALPGFAEGLVSIQDVGAQRATELLAPVTGERILDACAAPGGKSTHLLEAADIDLLALDIDEIRTQRIAQNLERLGLSATVKAGDCLLPATWWDGRPFDAILADVPCSASGVVRRHPDIKLLRRASDIRLFSHRQAAILDRLWPLLKVAGRLLYTTCSVFPEENAAQIDAFLVRQPAARRLCEERLLPCDEHDGFYHALLQKSA